MPKTSIAKKTRDSKHKRSFKSRDKVRQIKKNKEKTLQQNMYVDKIKELKMKQEVLLENQKKKEEQEEEENLKKKVEEEVQVSEAESEVDSESRSENKSE